MTVFCSDIDGTLLDPSRTLSARTVAAIRAVRAAGHEFVLCSSRMPSSMRLLEELYGGAGSPMVAYNGALVLSRAGEVVADHPIPPDAAAFVLELCAESGVHGSVHAGDDWYVWADDRWSERERANTGVTPSTILAGEYLGSGMVADSPPHKIMCMGDEAAIDRIAGRIAGRDDVVGYRTKPTYLEVANATCSKGTGLRAVAAELGVPLAEFTYFGDNANDLPAFEVVGTSVAVANAKDEVLASADVVTSRHHDHGVAEYLEAWLGAAGAAAS